MQCVTLETSKDQIKYTAVHRYNVTLDESTDSLCNCPLNLKSQAEVQFLPQFPFPARMFKFLLLCGFSHVS